MRIMRFFVLLLLLAIALVVQSKWGAGFEGAPLVLGSLAAIGVYLDWYEIIFFALLAAWFMNSAQGMAPEVFVLIAAPFAAWGVRRQTMPSMSRHFTYVRRDIIAPFIALCGVLCIVYISAFRIGAALSPWPLVMGIVAAVIWSLFGVYLVGFLE